MQNKSPRAERRVFAVCVASLAWRNNCCKRYSPVLNFFSDNQETPGWKPIVAVIHGKVISLYMSAITSDYKYFSLGVREMPVNCAYLKIISVRHVSR